MALPAAAVAGSAFCPGTRTRSRLHPTRFQVTQRTWPTRAYRLIGMDALLSQALIHVPIAYERVVYPCSSMICGDILHQSTLDPVLRMEVDGVNPVAVLLITLALIYLTSSPGVLQGAVDAYVVAPLKRLTERSLDKSEVQVGRKLAQGGFGTVYLGTAGASIPGKIRRGQQIVVKKALEFGEAEAWMNERMDRAAPHACPSFLAAYPDGPPRVGTPLVLVWKFEGKATLADAMAARDFPFNVERDVLGRTLRISDAVARKAATIKVLMQQILRNLAAMHRTGLVHRDIKPQNMILSDEGLKLIDLGAAADLRVGINYVPNEYLLDPRYAPPQQYVMSPLTPRAPPTPLAALLSPVLWRLNQPDRFDMYSAGIVFMQMAFPNLRNDNNLIAFNAKLEEVDYDLNEWRRRLQRRGSTQFAEGLELLDAENGAGWSLLCQLVTFKPSARCSARAALRHPWISGASDSFVSRATSKVLNSVDSAVQQAVNAGNSVRQDVLSEVELYSELGQGEEQAPEPPKNIPRTLAWWQARARSQQKPPLGVIGRIVQSGASARRKVRRRLGGGATQRAYGPSLDSSQSPATQPSSQNESNGSASERSADFADAKRKPERGLLAMVKKLK